MKKVWFISILVLGFIYVGTVIGGDRPTVTGNKLLDVGECSITSPVCVTEEREDVEFLYQFIDVKPFTGTCDFIILFKKMPNLVETVYAYHDTADCPLDAKWYDKNQYEWVCIDKSCDENSR